LIFYIFTPSPPLNPHGRRGRGGHGLPKVSPGPTMPNLSAPYGLATAETAVRQFQGWLAQRAVGLQPSSTPFDTKRLTALTPMLSWEHEIFKIVNYSFTMFFIKSTPPPQHPLYHRSAPSPPPKPTPAITCSTVDSSWFPKPLALVALPNSTSSMKPFWWLP
jgi:hypothetical protein